MKILFLLISAIALTACSLESPAPRDTPLSTTPASERIESNRIMSKELTFGTGALAERLLPTGILDIGNISAPVTLLLFTEHHCKYCNEFQEDHFPRLVRDYIEKGTLRFQVIPLELEKYKKSREAAAGLLCAALQGRGMEFHNLLMQRIRKERLKVSIYAAEMDLNTSQFAECMESTQVEDLLTFQRSLAKSLDVTLVPTFFLNGERSIGLPYYADLTGMIEEKINE